MPYRTVYEPASKDPSIEVVQELPEGIEEKRNLGNYRMARGSGDRYFEEYTYCRHCGGWVKSHANMYSVNTTNSHSLSGRNGQDFHCARCGERIGFMGMMS